MAIDWLGPWWTTEEWSDEQRDGFARQLHVEVGPDHPLFGLPVRVVARHDGCDDALFELLDGTGRFALVHLTWAKSQEQMPWPGTTIYESLEVFAKTQMLEDHNEFKL